MDSLSAAQSKRIEAIYACLNDGDLAQAARQTERSEVSALPLAKALRAVAMYRSGNREFALALCSEALEPVGGQPCKDVRTLAAVGIVWRPLGLSATLAAAYDAASAAAPNDETLARELPLAYAHAEDWKKAQSSALRAYKATGKPIFVLWAAFAIHVTTSSATAMGEGVAPLPLTGGGRRFGADVPAPAAARPLAIAEMLLARALDACTPANRDAELLGLYLHSLVRLGRAGDAYKALVGKYAAPGEGEKTTTVPDVVVAAAVDAIDTAYSLGDASSAYPFADGKGGRGTVPSALQPVDALRYAAYLLTEAAVSESKTYLATATATATATPTLPVIGSEVSSSPAIGSWRAAQDAYGALLERVDGQDWATHCGLAYTWARRVAGELEVSAAGDAHDILVTATQLLAPISSEPNSAGPSGLSGVDNTLLRPAVMSLVTATTAAENTVSDTLNDNDTGARMRGTALSSIQLQAVRCELSSRLLARAQSASAVPALVTALPALAALSLANDVAFGALVSGYVIRCGSLACVASDLRPLLSPFLLASSPLTKAAADARAAQPLASFLTLTPAILAVPFAPTAEVGGASDMAPLEENFSWSFEAAPSAREALLSVCERARIASRPDGAFRDMLHCVLARAEDAAAAARQHKGKGAAATPETTTTTSTTAIATDDPHGINAVLAPPSMLAFSPSDAAVLKAARTRVRRYASALQVLRLLSALGATPSELAAQVMLSIPTSDPGAAFVFATSRALVVELTDAWAAALPLHTATVAAGGEKDVGEADEIALLAAHILIDVALARLLAARCAPGGDAGAAPHRFAAHAALLETLVILAQGAAASPHNAQFALGSLRAHAWLGSNTGVLSAWLQLRVRHMLHNTLAHTIAAPLMRLVWPEQLRAAVIDPLAAAMRELDGETPSAIVTSLRSGHVSSALDVLRFRLRMRNSAATTVARSTAAGLHFAAHARSPAEVAMTCHRASGASGEKRDPFFADTAAAALLTLRDNDDRALPAAWEPLSPAAVLAARRGTPPSVAREHISEVLTQSLAAFSAAATLKKEAATKGGEVIVVNDTATAGNAVPLALAQLARVAINELGTDAWGEVASWRGGGGTGGMAERIVRRAARDIALSTRSAIFTALSALHEEVRGERAAGANDAITQVDGLLAAAGFAGPRVIASTTTKLASDTAVDGDGKTAAAAELLGDWAAGGSLPFLDSGAANARHEALDAGSRALRCALYAAKAACAAARGVEGIEIALNEAGDDVTAAAAILVSALRAATAHGLVEPSVDNTATAAATATAAIDPRSLAELSFLLFTVAPAVGVSLGIATRALMSVERGKGNKSVTACAKKALTALGAGAGALSRAFDGASASLAAMRTALDAEVVKAIRFVVGDWDASKDSWSPTVAAAAARVDWANDAEDDIDDAAADLRLPNTKESNQEKSTKTIKTLSKKAMAAAAATAAATVPVATSVPSGSGRDWLVRVEISRAYAFKRAFRDPIQHVGASYTVIFERLKNVSSFTISSIIKKHHNNIFHPYPYPYPHPTGGRRKC